MYPPTPSIFTIKLHFDWAQDGWKRHHLLPSTKLLRFRTQPDLLSWKISLTLIRLDLLAGKQKYKNSLKYRNSSIVYTIDVITKFHEMSSFAAIDGTLRWWQLYLAVNVGRVLCSMIFVAKMQNFLNVESQSGFHLSADYSIRLMQIRLLSVAWRGVARFVDMLQVRSSHAQ